ncbi:MAG: ATP-binding protein [Nitrospiraceae bacterium]|nr:MAG: ATP-binding protein [Nitrospiraceae bacterium]
MTGGKPVHRVNIRPGVSVLSVLRHLNYKPWFALAEFIDNALQSYFESKENLLKIEGNDFKLRINIDIDSTDAGRISVRDNAGGIDKKDFPRAFRPAELPPNRSGLGEFGMGMKSAACWFSPMWSVRTSALGESDEKTVAFDISRIVQDEIEELDVDARPADKTAHFTEIVLSSLYHVPAGRTLGKIKDHLRDIYRVFTQQGLMVLKFNGEELIHQEPDILMAPSYRNENGPAILWRKGVEFNFGNGLRAHGFAAIRKTASTSFAGFSLFRRNRLIQGSGDEGYRPETIFGKPNSFVYQRLFGELHLEGFEVSHTKDGLQWDENEEPFLELLKEELSKPEIPLLQQAREYRVQPRQLDLRRGAEGALSHTSDAIKNYVPPVFLALSTEPPVQTPSDDLSQSSIASRRIIDVELQGKPWRIVIELSDDPAIGDWLEINDQIAKERAQTGNTSRRTIGLRLSLRHPFMERFSGVDPDQIEPLLRVAAALGLAEVAARESGVRYAGTVRRNVNELLRNALWRT